MSSNRGARRTVVVTGASGGLGRVICQQLVMEEYHVVGISRRPLDHEWPADGYSHIPADLSDLSQLPQLVRSIVGAYGVPYGLVNNAATASHGLLPVVSDAEIQRVLNINLVSPMMLAKHLGRRMISAGEGRIINVTSIVASVGFRGLAVYSAAKAGLEGFSRSLARDLGPRGVTVNSVAPGFLDTAMTEVLASSDRARIVARSPVGRFAEVDEVAAAVRYYLSDQAAGITGTVLTVDAGATA